MFAFPIIAALFMDLRASLIALAINALTIAIIGVLLSSGHVKWGYTTINATEKWIVIGINFMFLNTLVSIMAAAILKGLQDLLDQRKSMVVLLERKQKDLVEANQQLENGMKERIKAEESRRMVEAQLQRAQKMESVGRLAGGVAHDYNNMLTVIMGYAEIALEKVHPDQPLHGEIEEIQKAARRSTEITRQLLAFARKQTIAPQVLDLNETVEKMLKMIRRLIGCRVKTSGRSKSTPPKSTRLWPICVSMPGMPFQAWARWPSKRGISHSTRNILQISKGLFPVIL